MSTLPMATEPSVNYNCDFNLIELPDVGQHFTFSSFVIETKTKTITARIAFFLGISHDWCDRYLDDQYVYCQLPKTGFKGHYGRYKGITLDQLKILWNIAQNNRADKLKPLISELIFTQVMPLFNQAVTTPQVETTPAVQHEVQTMTSLEIAELTGKAHRNVMRDIEKLNNELGEGVLKIEQGCYTLPNTGKQQHKMYKLDREATLLLTSGYSAQLRLKIIRRLDELETGKVTPPQATPTALVVPQNLPDALRLAATLAEEKEAIAHERDEAVRTKAQIRDKQLASAMGKAGNLAKKVKQLELMISDATKSPTYDYATVLAIQSRYKQTKVSGLKLTYYCRRMGLEMRDIPDPKYGYVHSYPAEAWRGVYGIDINRVLQRVA